MTHEENLFERHLKSREKTKASAMARYRNNPAERLFYSAQARAKKAGLEFNLEQSDIQIPSNCPYLGTPITNIWGHGRLQTNLSLDRIDNTKGYIKGNVQIISDLANRMKQEASIDQLVTFAKNVLDKHSKM